MPDVFFDGDDVLQKVDAKFVHNTLPDTAEGPRKPYILRPANQAVLDVHQVASKAEVLNITTSPQIIEEGANAYFRLHRYLSGAGFKIKNPICTTHIKFPGEYDGHETHLHKGLYPQVRMQIAPGFRKYIAEKTETNFDGFFETDGYFAEVLDEATGLIDVTVTLGGVIVITGYGLKIDGEGPLKDHVGLFFVPRSSGQTLKAQFLPVNEPRLLKAVVPASLIVGKEYRLQVVTMTSARGNGRLLKETRQIRSDFYLEAAAPVVPVIETPDEAAPVAPVIETPDKAAPENAS
jgi:hypothetical protein